MGKSCKSGIWFVFFVPAKFKSQKNENSWKWIRADYVNFLQIFREINYSAWILCYIILISLKMRHTFSPDFNQLRITCILMLSSVSRKILMLTSSSALIEVTSLTISYNCFHEICPAFSMNQCWFSLLRRLVEDCSNSCSSSSGFLLFRPPYFLRFCFYFIHQ